MNTQEELTCVFVYGTLLPGERNAGVAAQGGAFQAIPARLPGFRLLHLWPEDYPGIVPARPSQQVLGTVLTYAPEDWPQVLPFLDALEGVAETPPLYRRGVVTVTLEDGQRQVVWTYIYADAERLTRPGVLPLPEGDWRTHPRRTYPRPGER